MGRTAIIVAGGDQPPAAVRDLLPADGLVVAADSGYHRAVTLGLDVDVLIGDMDSIERGTDDTVEGEGVEVVRHAADKDATDLELALDLVLARGADEVTIVGGASFERIDHFMANALLLASPRFAPLHPRWLVKDAVVWAVHDAVELHGRPGDVVTLLPVGGPAGGVTTTGLRWPLEDELLQAGSTRGVSNLLVDSTVTVTVSSGTLLAIHHREDA